MNDDKSKKTTGKENNKYISSKKYSDSSDYDDNFKVEFPQELDLYEDFSALRESLKQQVNDELEHTQQAPTDTKKKNSAVKKFAKNMGITGGVLILCAVFLIGTPWGRSILYKVAGNFIYNSVDKENPGNNPAIRPIDDVNNNNPDTQNPNPNISHDLVARTEDYVTNYLIFGIEEIEGARNTDSMMIASINTKDDSIKLTSVMRDTYIQNKGENPTKLNAVYAKGGVDSLIKTIEANYKIAIDGYAYINFNSFEKIIDRLGGITIELGTKEANYLNRTNYISNPAYRNVHAGVNTLNGNQALGYCRVRKVATLEGVSDDYGRTLRQRKVLQAIFDKYKSKNVIQLITIMQDCLGYVSTNLKEKQIEQAIEDIVENKITTMDTLRIPVDNSFSTPGDYNGVNDPLVIDWDTNLTELYKFIYNDTDEQAAKELAER